MDKLKQMGEKLMGKKKGGASSSNTQPGQDYGDKAIEAIEKKTGHAQSAQTNEKITDKGREFFEKETGKKVPGKFSN